ncbi:SAM-dependent methyltransferase [Actinomycetospora termitidis]|uniref:SAM-dependent methyltransferase n=1 Tax=Actinomycetospora termitidis TaxID=3053470 RepID=A0ABT7M353_9PSEU|nr:SAM-dependent methyltransferase [Actinomycetospora sp. Odt1-22]MDL5155092.1 SAM-dependent methyltransferase [Actinomycetospora sp. Odt1-22]
MTRPAWAPREVDIDRPSAARVYDYYLGGSHNFAVDREMARQAIADWPDLPRIMQGNRAFMRRAVRYCAALGIDQFLDVGSGIPTAGNVHEVARLENPDARVVYVDVDPVAVAHSVALLADDDRTGVVQADFSDVDAVLGDPVTRGILDLGRPVAFLAVALLHFVPDTRAPRDVIGRYRDALAPGSHLVLSHATADGVPERAVDHVALYRRTDTPMSMRPHAEVLRFFDGFSLVEPGLVWFSLWRPDHPVGEGAERLPGYAGVGRRD